MKSRQWIIAAGLLALVLAAVVALVLTRDSGTPVPTRGQNDEDHPAPLVDERPLLTARNMSKLATDADEKKLAEAAVKAADDEVDMAFHDAIRDAANHPPLPKPQAHELYQHVAETEADVRADQNRVNQLKKQIATASAAQQVILQPQLDVAQAQLDLDQDELNDAKEDVIRSGADPGGLIQRQFNEHQEVEHAQEKEASQSAHNQPADYRAIHMLPQFRAWGTLRASVVPLVQARDQAIQVADELTKEHDALDRQLKADKTKRKSAGSPAPELIQSAETTAVVKNLHSLSDDQKNLSDLDKRIQSEQDLTNTYNAWIALVRAHERTALHGMILSGLLILVIILVVYLADRAIDHYLADRAGERNRLHTLRVVIRFGAQVFGALGILYIIFGAPQQTPTILGLAGAGLTVALKDFIVAFFGWFVLIGKNGIRVGDWVEINGVAGEVVEINLLRTVLLETGNWTDTGHPTGRKVAFVNSYAIEGHFFNFTTSGQWLWDELQVLVPIDRDPYALIESIKNTVEKETEANARTAEEEWQHETSGYRVRSVSATPAVNLRPTNLGVEVHVRYITRAHERHTMRARLYQAIVALLRSKGKPQTQTSPVTS